MYLVFTLATLSLCLEYSVALTLRNATNPTLAPSHNIDGKNEPRQGWTSSPNIRGTIDIVWSCVLTIFLCCWSMLCLNVPGPKDSTFIKYRRKAWCFVLLLCGPDMAHIPALGQYYSAGRSVREFAAADITSWTLQHAFFADMGGFVLQTPDWVPFPITAKQLLWLMQHNYVSLSPELLGRIKDKNKVDGMMRFVMVLQTLWFLLNFFARLAQGLGITLMELTTVAFIYSSLLLVFIWRAKPADVEISEVLVSNASMREILSAAGEAAREPYSSTPLDFIDRKEWAWTVHWTHMRNLLRFMRIMAPGIHIRPVDHFSNYNSPEIPTWLFCGGAVYYSGFAAILLTGWNLTLPSRTEQLLWRISCLGCLFSVFAGLLIKEIVFPFLEVKHRKPSIASKPQHRGICDWMRNNSIGQDPRLTIPLRLRLLLYAINIPYACARTFIVVEVFLELRSLPLSCYKTPEWQDFVPHLG